MPAGDLPVVQTADTFLEGGVSLVPHLVADSVVLFPNIYPWSAGHQDAATGWIDVRGQNNLVVLVLPVGQNATYTLESKRTSTDPAVADLVAATAVTAGVNTELYNSTLVGISHVRLQHRYTTTTGGTTTASFLAES